MLTTESEVWYTSKYPCAYPQDTIGYAACRFIMHCSKARDSLIADAVRLRPGRGKASRPLIRLIRTKANDLELEGKYATIHVTVSQGMITVKGVEVTGDDNQCIMNYLTTDDEETEPIAFWHGRCPFCGSKDKYNSRYDAFYCDKCDRWLEETCEDPHCDYCATRPFRPSIAVREAEIIKYNRLGIYHPEQMQLD